MIDRAAEQQTLWQAQGGRAVATGFSLRNSELQTQNPEFRTALKAVAKEMEAMFVYQMLKAMRETTNSGFFGKGLGNETYTSLFDMELARLFAERGLGLQNMLIEELNRRAEITEHGAPSLTLPHRGGGQEREGLRTPNPEYSFPVKGRISSWFGMRQDPFTGEEKFHHGIDIAAPQGREIFPVKNGKVIFSGYLPRYGNTVIIEHENGFITKYAHNMVNLVSAGEDVGPDRVIALVGSTGRATGPHLHFEVKYKGENIDPLKLWAWRS